jgi:hypothetical protein
VKLVLYPFAILFFIAFGEPANWKLVKKSGTVEVYTASIEGQNIKNIKASVEVDVPISIVAAVIMDVDHYTEWGYQCKESKSVKRPVKNEVIFYYLSYTPWPVKNRDLVSHVVFSKVSNKEVWVNSHNVEGYINPKPDMIRIPRSQASWHLREIAPGRTKAEYRLALDPGGIVPSWLINLFITDGPYKTLSSLINQVKHPRYINAKLSDIFEDSQNHQKQ